MDTLEREGSGSTNRFQKARGSQREQAILKTLFKRKHFPEILRLLYQKKTIRQKDIVETLGISKGVVCQNMNELDVVGFVRQEKAGGCKYYYLLKKGAAYYETHFLTAPQAEPGPELVPDTIESILDRIDGAIEELRSLRDAIQNRRGGPRPPATVLNEKNFARIMQVLYEAGDIPLSDLCTRLERPHGNVYRDMQNLTLEGFVKKETVKHCNYYALSEMGREYCEERFPPHE